MNIGQRIKSRRKEMKISADELAAKLGKDRSTIYRYEKGDIENLPLDILEPIANALDTTPQYLMGWETEISKPPKETASVKDGNRTMGDVIKSLRINRKLSLVECSEELGIPLSDLQKYENGNKQLTTNIVNDIARKFGLESADITDSFLYLEDNSPKNSFRREYVNNIRIWNEEFGQDTFTQEEIQELFKYGRYLRWKRDN